jgi:hypothetical protein
VISSSGSACIKNKSISFINLNHLCALNTKLVFCFCQPVFLFGRRVLCVSFCPPLSIPLRHFIPARMPGEEGESDNGDGGWQWQWNFYPSMSPTTIQLYNQRKNRMHSKGILQTIICI